MRALLIAAALAGAAFATAAAAQPKPPGCPTVTVMGPYVAEPSKPFALSASVENAGDVTPTYNWVISAGVIASGQGTSTITVNPEGSNFVTATVDVGGFDRDCSTASSHSVDLSAGG
jgi:hypothetical protein